MKIGFVTFGCKVNAAESEMAACELTASGAEVGTVENADVVIVNSCAVTAAAADKCGRYLASLKKSRPNVKILLTGCMASEDPETFKKMGVDAVVTNGSKEELVRHAIALTDGLRSVESAGFYGGGATSSTYRTRSFFKIQDGCDGGCAYCIIPRLRGPSRSMPARRVEKEFASCVESGFKEIVLVGIHIGTYDSGDGRDLAGLLESLTDIPGDYRIRLSSVEPDEITERLLEVMAANPEKICPHLHIPLQSGSNDILRAMRRSYTAEDYVRKVRAAFESVPDLTVGSDVIAGFPGETEKDFRLSAETVLEAGANFLHVFPYSDRPGTVASAMEGKIRRAVKEERARLLRELGGKLFSDTLTSCVGRRFRILTERNGKGYTPNYLPVTLEGVSKRNEFIEAELAGVTKDRLLGRPVSQTEMRRNF